MNVMPNSAAARDIAYYIHPQTNLRHHQEVGPVVMNKGDGIYVEDEEDHLIKSVSFTDSKGFLYGPYTSMSSLYDIINLKTINFPVGQAPPFDDVGF